MRVITIDGPAGSGKSTMARRLAKALGFVHFDSGALYRAIALHYIRTKRTTPTSWSKAIESVPISASACDGATSVYLNGECVDGLIRDAAVTNLVSPVSASIPVRKRVNTEAAIFASKFDLVADGRDMGTVVFPDAQLKFFLDATPVERARRRHLEFAQRGRVVSFETVLAEQISRDENDRNKPWGALRAADDALIIDTTGLTIEQVFERLLEISNDRYGKQN